MKAENGFYLKNRQILHDILPIDTPLLTDFQISNICNFKCNYCIQSQPDDVFNSSKLVRQFMPMDVFDLAVEQLKEFPSKIKQVSLVGFGEPLLNKNLPKMIETVKNNNLTDNILVITNASLLTNETAEKLVRSGLNFLRISLQGITSESYYKTCGAKIEFEKLYNQIKYFSEIKGDCKLAVKIADTSLEDGEESRFYDLFGDICDAVAVDHIVEAHSSLGMDYTIKLKQSDKNRYGHKLRDIKVCRHPFTRIDIRSDGYFANCCSVMFGFEKHIREATIKEQWNGSDMNKMRRDFLKHNLSEYKACLKCCIPTQLYHPEDVLDGYEDEILARMG
jgi:MoaA/NifB/PqqE/SkfB family radical SAM enzyme